MTRKCYITERRNEEHRRRTSEGIWKKDKEMERKIKKRSSFRKRRGKEKGERG